MLPHLVILLLFGTPATPAEPAESSTCLLRQVAELEAPCERGELAAETCSWIPILGDLADGDPDRAAERLESSFLLPSERAQSAVRWLEALTLIWLEDECMEQWVPGLVNEFTTPAGLQKLQDPAGLLLGMSAMGPAMGLPENLLELLAASMENDSGPVLRAAGVSLGDLFEESGLDETFAEAAANSPFPWDRPEPPPSEVEGLRDGEIEAIERLDEILASSLEGEMATFRDLVTAWEEQLGNSDLAARSLARAAMAMLYFGNLEDAVDLFRRADRRLLSSDAPESPYLRALLGGFHMLALQELGLDGSAAKVRRELEESLDSEARRVWSIFGATTAGSWPMEVGADNLSTPTGPLVDFEDLESMKPLMAAFQVVFTWSNPTLESPTYTGIELWNVLGHMARGDLSSAIGKADDLVNTQRRYSYLAFQILAAIGLMDEDLEEASRVVLRAVDQMEQQVQEFRLDSTARSFIDQRGFLFYRLGVELAGRAGRWDEAFRLAERGRSFSLRRTLGPWSSPARPRDSDPGISSRRQPDPTRADEAQRLAAELSSTGAHRTWEDERRLYRDFVAARWERRLDRSGEAAPDATPDLDLERFREEILGPDEAILAYFPGVGRLWIWVIRRDRVDGTWIVWDSDAAREVGRQAWALRWQGRPASLCAESRERGARRVPNCPEPTDVDVARTLYDRLIAPAGASLTTARSWIVIPHGPLHALPWSALRGPDGPVLEAHRISLSSGAPVLTALRQRSRADSSFGPAFVLGDPTTGLPSLPAARGEAEAASSLLGVEPLTGDRATERSVREAASSAGLLHLASHGIYDAEAPLLSRLELAAGGGQDGRLHVYEIQDELRFDRRPLVVLSACETAASKGSRGDDLLGLTQAFLAAGSSAVVSTLWPVEDRASASLMTVFYRNLDAGRPVAEALREAQLEIRAEEGTSSPYFWAGNVLHGDPDATWASAGSKACDEVR